ncbi:MAG: hypothetical protein WCF22_15805 [Candidatus Sulfotelmatobacter sp.]
MTESGARNDKVGQELYAALKHRSSALVRTVDASVERIDLAGSFAGAGWPTLGFPDLYYCG